MDTTKDMSVKCSVTNCIYNNSHMCYADSIEVNAMGDGNARSSDGTSCTTFKNQSDTSTY